MTPLAIDKVLTDTRLLGAALGNIETWATWIIALKAAFALPLDDEEREMFTAIAGDRGLPLKRVRELWCDRRSKAAANRRMAARWRSTSRCSSSTSSPPASAAWCWCCRRRSSSPRSCSTTCLASCARRRCWRRRSRARRAARSGSGMAS